MISLFQRKPRRYRTPGGKVYELYNEMAGETHLLVAGETGCGKSTAINGILFNMLHDSPGKVQFVMIDPKRTELIDYKDLPHVLNYAFKGEDIINALQQTVNIMELRLDEMQKRRLKLYDGPRLVVVIDELADLMVTMKKHAAPLLQRILQLGRAANIMVIAGTQVVNAKVISTEIRVNFTAIIGMRTATAAQSRLMVGKAGCEMFPDPKTEHRALGYYRHGCACELYEIPRYTDDQYNQILNWWTSRQCIA